MRAFYLEITAKLIVRSNTDPDDLPAEIYSRLAEFIPSDDDHALDGHDRFDAAAIAIGAADHLRPEHTLHTWPHNGRRFFLILAIHIRIAGAASPRSDNPNT